MRLCFTILATAFLLVSCGNNAPTSQLPPRINIYDLPSVSEFDRNKNKKANPTTEQVKKSLQLLADETAKDPESLKVRKVKVVGFRFFKNFTSDIKYFGHLVQADTDSKNSYGGYEGYKTKLFSMAKPGAMARFTEWPFTRGEIESADKLKKNRNELSDEEFVKWLGKDMYPEKKGRKDTYVFPESAMDAVWWIPRRP